MAKMNWNKVSTNNKIDNHNKKDYKYKAKKLTGKSITYDPTATPSKFKNNYGSPEHIISLAKKCLATMRKSASNKDTDLDELWVKALVWAESKLITNNSNKILESFKTNPIITV